jgi:undecaprenyl-diphosphatase
MRRLLVSCFGLGWLPVAPGTWGSLPPAMLFALMCYFSSAAAAISITMAVLALVGSVVCIKFAPAIVAATDEADPREVVADEFSGQAVTFLFIAAVPISNIWVTVLLGFLLFRFFDILKPWPIRKFEKLPKGWGILADDLMAGVYAGIALLFCLRIGLVEYFSGTLRFDGSSLNIFSASILGAVQGLTEFLPVSSSGHLVLLENLFHFDPEKPEMLLFDLIIHTGTVIAIFIVFRKSIAAFAKNLIAFGKYGSTPIAIYKKSPSVHLLVLAIVTTFVTSVLGLSFKHYFESARGSLAVIAVMWIINATLLLITDWRGKTRLGLRQFGLVAAVIVGLAQTAAIMPGISRSGATICAAILIGLHRRWAVEFSFLIAIPAILGATAVELIQNFDKINSAAMPLSAIIVGPAVAAIVGIAALKILIKVSRKANLKIFAFYCYILTCFVFFFLLK